MSSWNNPNQQNTQPQHDPYAPPGATAQGNNADPLDMVPPEIRGRLTQQMADLLRTQLMAIPFEQYQPAIQAFVQQHLGQQQAPPQVPPQGFQQVPQQQQQQQAPPQGFQQVPQQQQQQAPPQGFQQVPQQQQQQQQAPPQGFQQVPQQQGFQQAPPPQQQTQYQGFQQGSLFAGNRQATTASADRPFVGVAEATPTEFGVWLENGRHRIKVLACKQKLSENPKSLGVPCAIVEMEVLESTVPGVPGNRRSRVIKCQGFSWQEELKAFFMGVCDSLGQPHSTITEQAINEAFSGDGQLLAGVLLDVDVFPNKRNTWTKHSWAKPSGTPIQPQPQPQPQPQQQQQQSFHQPQAAGFYNPQGGGFQNS